ncbi:Tubulin polyglutamylase TTLL13 [Tritrichomonas foetus]|uniref:Tubulin polyglutamylase TTLL13 n=1 Tax=Tritrichomonas foetus TaxID=1144522 RepID=A0A1J4KJV5_9EUKA|nr:Tubulin polyglutamylase TTLL13 [Tritrichomonas foetus]|eukprot:OHT09621.1 Tubulin polyglutamylase TTLL13 [Tritrichomonas foetus]
MNATKKSPVLRKQPKIIWANLSNTHYMSVRQCVEELGYKITESEYKNMLLWCDGGGSIDIASSLQPWQFYNHFPGIWSIARKVELARNFDRMSRISPNVMNFHPKSFLLPGQFSDLKTYMLSIPKKTDRTFIVKPDRGSQGRGIILIQDPDEIEEYFDMSVAQQYIDPYLIDGYKFDLRIYVLVTSVDPLRIYIYKEGMARFCTEKYVVPKSSNLDQVFSHLTNYSLNKKNDHFQQPNQAENADEGSKRSLSSVYHYIRQNGGDVEKIQSDIESIIRLTLGSIQSFLSNSYHTAVNSKDEKSRCFEILGFDILLDSKLKPYLLEVNCMPSLACDSPFDTALKFGVIKGALKILDLSPTFKKQVLARQKAVTQVRISGATKLKIPTLFVPEVETEISKTTQWKQIYPFTEDLLQYEYNQNNSLIMEEILAKQKECPVGAAVETAASRARKEAVLAQIKLNENRSNPPKSARPASERRKINVTKDNKESKQKFKPPPRVASIKPKVIKPVKVGELQSPKLINEFADLPMQTIDEYEERERSKSIRKQANLASAIMLIQHIKKILNSQNQSSQAQPKPNNQAPKPKLPQTVIQPPQMVQIKSNQNINNQQIRAKNANNYNNNNNMNNYYNFNQNQNQLWGDQWNNYPTKKRSASARKNPGAPLRQLRVEYIP